VHLPLIYDKDQQEDMTTTMPTTRRACRRTDDFTPGAPKFKLVTEDLALPLTATQVLIKVHAVSLNYRDANIANGGNPWPVIPYGIPCNDAAGEIIAKGEQVSPLKIGDRVAPIIDTENLTGQESTRSWLAADEDGVLADYVIFDQRVVCRLPEYLDWTQASIIPCAGVTAWAAMKGFGIGKSVLIQGMCPELHRKISANAMRPGTGGVSLFALELARAAGLKVFLTSSSDRKLQDIRERYPDPPIQTINYSRNPEWHEEVLRLTDGVGVDLVIEVGGASTLLKSLKCTRRGGTVSQVGYLSKAGFEAAEDLVPLVIDRRVCLR
jgi:NADPH:quinone reductase-like Zn-dependent oxidoreductase